MPETIIERFPDLNPCKIADDLHYIVRQCNSCKCKKKTLAAVVRYFRDAKGINDSEWFEFWDGILMSL